MDDPRSPRSPLDRQQRPAPQARRQVRQQPDQRPRRSSAQPTRRASSQPGRRAAVQPDPRERQTIEIPLPLAIGVVLAVILICFVGLRGCFKSETPSSQTAQPVDNSTRVSFVAVGDNLVETQLSAYADAADGSVGDGRYDYSALYKPVASYIKDAGFSYINQEVHLGGADIGPQGYPSFNCMDDMADCLANLGFDFVASASNHCYDWGMEALSHSCNVFASKDVAYTGTATNSTDAQRIATVEREGIVFALLDYTYGVNGYEKDQIPEYAINFYSKDRLRADVQRAKEVADVVLVAMHWGTEKELKPDAEQKEYAKYLADLGVDMIIGSHPHCIQPMEWIEGAQGNKTLCVYSLGNFVSNHENPGVLSSLEGMVGCEFVRAEGSKEVAIENVTFTPLVSHREVSEGALTAYGVYRLKDYTTQMGLASKDAESDPDPYAWYRNTVQQVIGSGFAIDM